jgi:hypothetical protein
MLKMGIEDGKRIAAEIKLKWLRIGGYWYPRGGIPIDVFWQTGKLPKGMWVPTRASRPISVDSRRTSENCLSSKAEGSVALP